MGLQTISSMTNVCEMFSSKQRFKKPQKGQLHFKCGINQKRLPIQFSLFICNSFWYKTALKFHNLSSYVIAKSVCGGDWRVKFRKSIKYNLKITIFKIYHQILCVQKSKNIK